MTGPTKKISDLPVEGKRVFVRVDYNVPQKADGSIEDDTRIRASLPTLQALLKRNAILILASHLGRPKGKVKEEFRLTPVGKRLSELLKRPVTKLHDCIGPEVRQAISMGKPGDIFLLENLRFYHEEEKNDAGFAASLAELADFYVNDAFGASHRAHASIVGVPKLLPSAAGLLLEKEIAEFDKVLSNPARPFTAILGGAKVSDKIGVLKNLVVKCDVVLIGGAMAYTFLKAQGVAVGNSKVEDDKIDVALEIMEEARSRFVEFALPKDHVIADRFAEDAQVKTVSGAIPDGWMALDIGEATIRDFRFWVSKSRTVVWNGPMGVFEMAPFRKGTQEVGKAVGDFGGHSIVGGGDSVAAIESMGYANRISHISTGGGASLEMLEGLELPGIAVLTEKGSGTLS